MSSFVKFYCINFLLNGFASKFLKAAVDWINIKLKNVISEINIQSFLNFKKNQAFSGFFLISKSLFSRLNESWKIFGVAWSEKTRFFRFFFLHSKLLLQSENVREKKNQKISARLNLKKGKQFFSLWWVFRVLGNIFMGF